LRHKPNTVTAHQKRRAKERLDALLLEGLSSGDPVPVNAKFWSDLKKEGLATVKPRRKAAIRR